MLVGPFLGLGVPLLPGPDPLDQPAHPRRARRGARRRAGRAGRPAPASPHGPTDGILAGGLIARILVLAARAGRREPRPRRLGAHADRPWQSMVFARLALGQLGVALALRTGGRRFTGNPFLTVAVVADVALVLAALYLPALQALLGTEPLGLADLGLVPASLVGAVAVAAEHVAVRRRRPTPGPPPAPGRLPGMTREPPPPWRGPAVPPVTLARSECTSRHRPHGPGARRTPRVWSLDSVRTRRADERGGDGDEPAVSRRRRYPVRALVYHGAGKKDWESVPDPGDHRSDRRDHPRRGRHHLRDRPAHPRG